MQKFKEKNHPKPFNLQIIPPLIFAECPSRHFSTYAYIYIYTFILHKYHHLRQNAFFFFTQ